MTGQGESNLYIYCYTYRYTSSCIYKFITFFDGLSFLLSFINAAQAMAVNQQWPNIINILIALFMLYFTFKAWMLFFNFNSNISDGTLHAKSTDYLNIRKFLPILTLVMGCVAAGIILAFAFIINSNNKQQDSGVAIAAVIAAGVVFMVYAIAAWFQFGIQRSLVEATSVLCGSGLARNQVV